jgi:c-di-GMP-related signal transduction protein
MDTFIGRQPIFDTRQQVFGYELLFRSGLNNVFSATDPDQATSKVISDSFFLLGMPTLTGGKRAFINITRDFLLNEYVFLIPKESVVVEILETVEPDREVVAACDKLKRAGYLLAVDDFVYGDKYKPLLETVDFVKIDFLATKGDERKSLIGKCGASGMRFLAEKVETPEEYKEALALGYSHFQGYFFCKPTIISGKDIPAYKLHYLRILQVIHRPEVDFRKIGEIIKQEVSLSFKLLRYINSAYFGLRNKINSIMQALALLGEKEIKKWVSLIALANMGQDKPEELVIQALIRAKFCESLASWGGFAQRAEDLFLMGMFSLVDTILSRPLSEILKEIPIADDIKDALLGEKNRLFDIYELALLFEKSDWEKLPEKAAGLGIQESRAYQLYLDALKWSHRCFQGADESAPAESIQPSGRQNVLA